MKPKAAARKFRKLEKVRKKQVVPGFVVDALMAAGEDDARAQLARDRADAWAHSVPGTPYGSTTVTTERTTP